MVKTRHLRRFLQTSIALLIAILLTATTTLAEEKPAKPPLGRLVLEGKGIKKLMLEKRPVNGRFDPDSHPVILSPGRFVELPAGEYHVREADLEEGG